MDDAQTERVDGLTEAVVDMPDGFLIAGGHARDELRVVSRLSAARAVHSLLQLSISTRGKPRSPNTMGPIGIYDGPLWLLRWKHSTDRPGGRQWTVRSTTLLLPPRRARRGGRGE